MLAPGYGRLSTILHFYEWAGQNNCVSSKLECQNPRSFDFPSRQLWPLTKCLSILDKLAIYGCTSSSFKHHRHLPVVGPVVCGILVVWGWWGYLNGADVYKGMAHRRPVKQYYISMVSADGAVWSIARLSQSILREHQLIGVAPTDTRCRTTNAGLMLAQRLRR